MKYEIKKYKDGQVSARIPELEDLSITIRGNSYEDLFKVASIKEVWDYSQKNRNSYSELSIMCLIGQRSDRRFHVNESFDLKVIAKFINSMRFDRVKILHPHSSVSLALIDNSEALDHFGFVKMAFKELTNPVLVSPDAGAYKATYEIAEKLAADLVPSNKVRVKGNPLIQIQGEVNGRTCLIVDDLADGGRTFKYLAEELKKQGAEKVCLYVTHAQFNYGFEELSQSIDHIFCTNSYREIDNSLVTQYKIDGLT